MGTKIDKVNRLFGRMTQEEMELDDIGKGLNSARDVVAKQLATLETSLARRLEKINAEIGRINDEFERRIKLLKNEDVQRGLGGGEVLMTNKEQEKTERKAMLMKEAEEIQQEMKKTDGTLIKELEDRLNLLNHCDELKQTLVKLEKFKKKQESSSVDIFSAETSTGKAFIEAQGKSKIEASTKLRALFNSNPDMLNVLGDMKAMDISTKPKVTVGEIALRKFTTQAAKEKETKRILDSIPGAKLTTDEKVIKKAGDAVQKLCDKCGIKTTPGPKETPK